MGKKPAQIEADIKAQRAHISNRIEELERRAQDDIGSLQSEAKARASGAIDDAKGRIDNAKSSVDLSSLKSMVEQHTASTMAGAVGVGVLLGIVSEGFGGGNGGSTSGGRQSSFYDRQDSGGGGALSGLVASFFGPAANTAQGELQQLVREGFALLKDQVQQVKEGEQSDRNMLVRNRDVGVE
jgi:hypothetical protein